MCPRAICVAVRRGPTTFSSLTLRRRLRDRKVANIASVKPDMIAAGNIGCMVQIASGTSVPVVHTIELLDWATGGPRPGSNLIEWPRAKGADDLKTPDGH